MNVNIIKTQIFHYKKFDLKGHWRLLLNFVKKVLWFFTDFERKKISECKHHRDVFLFIKLSKTSKVTFLFTDPLFLRYIFYVTNLILLKFDMNANITKMQLFDCIKIDLIIILWTYFVLFSQIKIILCSIQGPRNNFNNIETPSKLETVCYARQNYLIELDFEYLLIMF